MMMLQLSVSTWVRRNGKSASVSRRRSLALLFFFFSSRRRHTRYWRDWSSDVCSSDLVDTAEVVERIWARDATLWTGHDEGRWLGWLDEPARMRERVPELVDVAEEARRSEERRVGKECRSRWSPYH